MSACDCLQRACPIGCLSVCLPVDLFVSMCIFLYIMYAQIVHAFLYIVCQYVRLFVHYIIFYMYICIRLSFIVRIMCANLRSVIVLHLLK